MDKTGEVIENLAKTNNLKFESIVCKPQSHNLGKQLGHIEVPLNILKEKMQNVENK